MDNRYIGFSDEKLAKLAQTGDGAAEETLIRKYMEGIRAKRHIYFIAGADSEDVIQEGMIGLFKAIRSYEDEKSASFRTYANICINRQIISAIRAAARLKHEPLNNSISLSVNDMEDVFYDNPEKVLLSKDITQFILCEGAEILSPFEQSVLKEYMDGSGYSAIAQKLGKSSKSIDNAMQRIRKKAIAYISG